MRWLILTLLVLPALATAEESAADASAERPAAAVIAPLAPSSLLLDVRALPDGRLVAVGERGHVLLSKDGGVSWQQAQAPARATLTAVYFADDSRGWAVGHDEVILRTVDGGSHWLLAHFAPQREQPLLAVWFDAAGHGFAVGAYSTVYRSDDAGASWQSVQFSAPPLPGTRPAKPAPGTPRSAALADDSWGVQPHLTGITADRAGRLYITAEAGHLYRSEDRGEHWYELPSPYDGSFFGILPLEGDALLAYGLRGHLYRSEDAGHSWRRIETGTQALLAGATRLGDGTIVIAGLEGVVLVSVDGGHAFRVHQEADRKGFDAAAPVPGGVVVCGETGARRLTLAELAPGS